MFYKATELIELINNSCKNKTPFLFAINYELTEGLFITNPLSQTEVLFSFNGVGNKTESPVNTSKASINISPIPFSMYAHQFNNVQHKMQEGLQVINLTIKTPIQTNISNKEIFQKSTSLYQLYIPNKFVCFSPERFVKIADGKISTNPMKGTIDASIPNAANVILDNPKEIAEHTKTVESICDDLQKVATNIHVERFRYIDHLKTNRKELLQVSSEVVGDLPNNYVEKLGNILFNLLPGGSIVGSPKEIALEAIKAIETETRGYYCGIAGYFDGNTLDTCVLIRFIEQEGDKQFFRSGGGITADSNCEQEYNEMLNKIYLPFA